MVVLIRNKQIAGSVRRHIEWEEKTGIGGGPAVPGITPNPIASHRRDEAVGVHFADALVAGVGDEQIAQGVHSHAERKIQAGVGGCAVAAISSTSHRRDNVVRKICAVELPLVGQRRRAGGAHAQGHRGPRRRTLALGLAGDADRQIDHQRGHRAGDRAVVVGHDDVVIVRVVGLGRIKTVAGVGRLQDRPGAVPPLVTDRRRAGGAHAQGHSGPRRRTLALRLAGNG